LNFTLSLYSKTAAPIILEMTGIERINNILNMSVSNFMWVANSVNTYKPKRLV